MWIIFQHQNKKSLETKLKDLKTGETFRTHNANKIIYQLIIAIAYVHGHPFRFIHRDIKPENIFLTTDGTALLGDFGLVVDYGGKSHQSTKKKGQGTKRQLPPESDEYEDDQYTQKFDIWQLAVMAYELVVGKHPCPNLDGVHPANFDLIIGHWIKQKPSGAKYPPQMFSILEADFAEFIRNSICEIDDRWDQKQVIASAYFQRLKSECEFSFKIRYFD